MSSELRRLWEHAGGQVPDAWKIVPLESLLRDSKSIAVGVMYPGPDTLGGTPLIKVGDIKDGTVPVKPSYCISDKTNEEHKRTQLIGDELLITLVGNPGECVVVSPAMAGWNPARAIATIRLQEPNLRIYLKTVLESTASKHLIDSVLNTTVQKTLNLKDIRKLPIPLPPKQTIQDISEIAEVLTNRIALLRETNTTLETIAQALFKSWFVDFDPVRAKQEGREPEGIDTDTAALFPDSFEESELGLVPKGWRVTNCQNIIDVRDGTHESPKPSQEGLPLITSRHITGGRINFDDTYLISEQDYENISKRSKVHRLDVLITMIGTVGLTVIVMEETVEFAIKNIGLFKTSAVPHMCHYFYLLLSSSRMQQYLEARLAGTTQKYLSLKALRKIAVLVPSESVLTVFSKIISPVFERVHQNNSKAQTLATLRDTLLPRLISGQLRLPDAEAMVGDV